MSQYLNRMWLGIAGIVLLIIGVFSPVIKVLWLESDYWKDGEGDGVIIVILAVIAFGMLFLKRFQWTLWIPTVLIFLTLIYDYVDITQEELVEARYGWLFLFAGAVLLAIAAAMPTKKPEDVLPPAPPPAF